MSENAQPLVIDDMAELLRPDDHGPFLCRIRELSAQRYIVRWMLVEIEAIAILLEEGAIRADQVWQQVLTLRLRFYGECAESHQGVWLADVTVG